MTNLTADVRLALRSWRKPPGFAGIADPVDRARHRRGAANDPVTVFGMMLLLLVVALIAGLIPSAKAARLSPTLALRRD